MTETAASNEVVTADSLGINEQDSVDRATQWILHGKIDAKHFNKVLPLTAKDLRESKIAPKPLVVSLGRVLNPTLKVRTDDCFDGTILELICHRLAKKSIPDWWCRNADQEQWLVQAHSGFARDLYESCESKDTSTFTCPADCDSKTLSELLVDAAIMAYSDIALLVQAAVRETCEKWAQRVDETLFPGKRSGTFLFLCPTNGLSPNESLVMVRDIFDEGCGQESGYWEDEQKIKGKKQQLRDAVSAVRMGAVETLKSCWECEGEGQVLRKCSKCSVALYCCKGESLEAIFVNTVLVSC